MKFAYAPESKPLEGFTIKRAIHRGGFGEVYYALTDAGKEVALKLLHNNLEVELRGVSQCLNLKHPNLVTIFDMRQDSEKDHWIVMEYVGGKSLYDCVQEHPAGMPLNDVLAWLSGMAAGLSFLHDRGLVHRDLKPANVFSDAGVVKIGDVGLSKYISESRRSAQTQSVGTVYYMAPEVARGRYGREVDVYSMGVMLYEMMTGRVPFEGETTAEILMKHLTAEPDLSVLPEKLRPVISAALEKDPDRRINDVEELERRLRTCVAESGFPVEQPAPLLKPRPDKNHSRAAVASTIIAESPKKPAERGIRSAWNSLVTVWNEQVPTPLKWVISGAVIILLIDLNILRTGPIMSGGIVGGLAYLLYRKFWKKDVAETTEQLRGAEIELSGAAAEVGRQAAKGTQATSPGAQPVMVAAPRHVAPVPQPVPMSPRNYSPVTMRQIPKGQRAIDITTSLSVSLAAVALVTAGIHLATEILPNPADVAFFASTILIASWALIVPAKLWEGRTGDQVVRRIVQGTLGLGVGAVAAVIQNFLMLNDSVLLQASNDGVFSDRPLGRLHIVTSTGMPTIAGFMMFFGLLFLIRRWWWQADSFRKSRFRISSALVTLVLGLVIGAILPFPETLGATLALAISAVVQLSASWTPAEERFLTPAPGSAQAAPMLARPNLPVQGIAPAAQKA